MQASATDHLVRELTNGLKEAGVDVGDVTSFATPRRIGLCIADLPVQTEATSEERRGPRADAPDKAIEGFLRSTGLTRDQLVTRETKKGDFLFAVIESQGQDVAALLADLIPGIVRKFQWQKSMRWGAGSLNWVRPLQSILCLFDGKVVPFQVEDIAAGNKTQGHRFMAPAAFEVSDFADYQAKLEAAKVMIDPAARSALIKAEAEKLAAEAQLDLIDNEALLKEVAGLVEWPVPLLGRFDPGFLEVPEEVLTYSMADHQKYFALKDKNGKLAPAFILASNLIAKDGGAAIVDGNERVLAARLADARFFYDQDLKKTLESRLPQLEDMVFHARLGSQMDRVGRLEKLAAHIADLIGADGKAAAQAAHLCKADLVSEMVTEFPEVQGIMGATYARAEGIAVDVAAAIETHYAPQGPGDECPTAPVSIALAMAEKLDTLAGFFGIGELPTGSKDPFALRRAALGVIRLILENDLRFDLQALFAKAAATHDRGFEETEVAGQLMDFTVDRLKVYLRDQGLRHDWIAAVFALPGQTDLTDIVSRVRALGAFLTTDDGADLLAGQKRAANILRIEAKKDGDDRKAAKLDAALLSAPAEQALAKAIEGHGVDAAKAAKTEDYEGAMAALAKLRGPVDAFFDDVKVNDDDPKVRINRLCLLAEIDKALSEADGDASQKNLLGGKGANLAEMCHLGLPVPPGFTITTDVCTAFYDNNRNYPDGLTEQVEAALAAIGATVGKGFGDPENPLLVSIRSGARASMPGMMDTVLNLGLNDETVAGLAALSGDERFAYDSYRRFIQMYSDVVLELDHYLFEDILEEKKEESGTFLDTDLSADDWKAVIEDYKALIEDELDAPFPQDPMDQLWGAIGAVFGSWQNARAITYRRLNDIPDAWGTAVNVQAMVFGNMGEDSATGVAFTRDPSTGEKIFFGEYLINAQGEDVVAGIRTPLHLTKEARERAGAKDASMEETLPVVFGELTETYQKLEAHYRDMQDLEFTVERGKLWMLQTRSGKRTAPAAIRIAVEMAEEGLITKEEAIGRVDPAALDQLLHPTLDPNAERKVVTRALPASPGAASGKAVFTADDAEDLAAKGEKVILVRTETSPEDIHGMHAADGILTARGGMTSHAAVVARGMGRPCVSGAGDLRIDEAAKTATVAGQTIKEGDIVTIDGGTGEVMLGEIAMIQPQLSGEFATLMGWADDVRKLHVRANAETPEDAKTARGFGAEGIGLCRTEHMFFDADRIVAMREMILAGDQAGRAAALEKLLPFQRADFESLFSIMKGLPVTIRLLDPPLHEFLPHSESEIAEVAAHAGVTPEEVKARTVRLSEANPMLGHRGCRLGITYPEIYEMQARAIFEAALSVSDDEQVVPEIMIPLVTTGREIEILKARIDKVARDVFAAAGRTLTYHVGTMIELPRAALRAGEIAEQAEFFSFGTNDLTQTTFGLSRDDAGAFLTDYVDQGIYEADPFVTLDPDGVGALIEIAAEKGRAVQSDLKLGLCGEHGGDPASINFVAAAGLDYVSCSPYRVPIARLAAAQAALNPS
ncbi:ppdK [Symbiodinium microadriaticum]|nr:ppdK [Symbiodinium microadriaticum]